MDILSIMFHSWYLVKHRLALCVCMDIQWVIFHSSSCSSPGGRKKLVLQTVFTVIETGARYTDVSCLLVVPNVLRNYCEILEIQYNYFHASPVLCCTCGMELRHWRELVKRPAVALAYARCCGFRFPNDRNKKWNQNYTRKLTSMKHISVGNTLD
jgi:hypothetical protein